MDIVEYMLPINILGKPNNRGKTGPVGKKGATGPTGLSGPQGATGVQGIQGIQGATSILQGATGVQGSQGDTGPLGHQGATGVQGTNGNPGDKGQIGPQGDIGPNGTKGQSGVKGLIGYTGANVQIFTSGTGIVTPQTNMVKITCMSLAKTTVCFVGNDTGLPVFGYSFNPPKVALDWGFEITDSGSFLPSYTIDGGTKESIMFEWITPWVPD